MNAGADIRVLNRRDGTLWQTAACYPSSQALMDLLMQHSSIDHLNRKSNYGFTPLDLALEFGDDATADYLSKLGAKTS